MKKKSWFVVVPLFLCMALFIYETEALADEFDIVFYEGNGCTQDIVFKYNSRISKDENCKAKFNVGYIGETCVGDNDEARSVLIKESVARNTRIFVYDSPGGSRNDDWSEIIVGKVDEEHRGNVCVRTFEKFGYFRAGRGRAVKINFHRINGLDGKVSRVQIVPPQEKKEEDF